ncbi:MAG: 30S ribosomal protein THX [Syntrophorhabdus sp.]
MGKGDKRTKRGKIGRGSSGKSRPKKGKNKNDNKTEK